MLHAVKNKRIFTESGEAPEGYFFLKNDILLTYDMYVYLEIHNYIIYDISIYDAFWSNLVCFQLHLSKWNVWCHRKLRHQNPSRHGCLHHRPSPRQASDFAGGYGSIEKNGVPMASPWVDEIFSIHCRKNGEIMGHFFLKSEQIWKSSIFFKKNPWIFATSPHPWGCHCEALEERLQGSSLSMLKGRRIETQQGKALQTTVYIILVIYYVSVHVLLNVMCVLHVCMYIYTYWLSYLYIFNCDLYDMIVVWYSKEHVYQWQCCLLWSWCNRRLRLRNRSMCSRR